jgi:hypothetical protein
MSENQWFKLGGCCQPPETVKTPESGNVPAVCPSLNTPHDSLHLALSNSIRWSVKKWASTGKPRNLRLTREFSEGCVSIFICYSLASKTFVMSTGLTVGHEALMVDLLAPHAPVISLRDGSASAAIRGLAAQAISGPEDVCKVMHLMACLLTSCSCSYTR